MEPDKIDMIAGWWTSINIVSIIVCFMKILRIIDWSWWIVSLPLIIDCVILLICLSIVTILSLYSNRHQFH